MNTHTNVLLYIRSTFFICSELWEHMFKLIGLRCAWKQFYAIAIRFFWSRRPNLSLNIAHIKLILNIIYIPKCNLKINHANSNFPKPPSSFFEIIPHKKHNIVPCAPTHISCILRTLDRHAAHKIKRLLRRQHLHSDLCSTEITQRWRAHYILSFT